MKKYIMAAAALSLFCTTLYARSIPNAPNEVEDPYFQYQQGSWYFAGMLSLTPNSPYLPGYSVDPGHIPYSSTFLRTIVDDATGLWDPNLNKKEIDISFFAKITGDGRIGLRFDWWDDVNMPEPPADPNFPISPAPQYTNWMFLTESNLGLFTVRDDLLTPSEVLPSGYHLYNYHTIWDRQPRWVSIEFDLKIFPDLLGGNGDGLNYGDAILTGVDFEARCVPEPGALFLCAFGIALWLGKRIKTL